MLKCINCNAAIGSERMGKLTYVFVHGLAGWGSNDSRYQRIPYWGMRARPQRAHAAAG